VTSAFPWVVKMVSELLPSMRWWERAQAQWGTLTGTLGLKRGWLWRPTLLGNEDVLICINAPFMTQRILKSWWSWIYQNSVVKRASARTISRWVTSWEVWFEKLHKKRFWSKLYVRATTRTYKGRYATRTYTNQKQPS